MSNEPKSKIVEYIEEIPDSRSKFSLNFKHPLSSVIFIVFVCSLCGANSWTKIETMGKAMQEWIAKFVSLPNGIPSHDTFGRSFGLINPKAFNDFLIRWMESVRDRIGAQNLSVVRKITMGMLTKDKSKKHGTNAKRLAAAVDPGYRENLFKIFYNSIARFRRS